MLARIFFLAGARLYYFHTKPCFTAVFCNGNPSLRTPTNICSTSRCFNVLSQIMVFQHQNVFLCPNKTCFLTPPISSNVSVIGPPQCALATAEKKGKNRAFAENPETRSGNRERKTTQTPVVFFSIALAFFHRGPMWCVSGPSLRVPRGFVVTWIWAALCTFESNKMQKQNNKQRPKQQAKKRKHKPNNKQQRTKNPQSTNERTTQRMAQLTNGRINNTTIKKSKQSKANQTKPIINQPINQSTNQPINQSTNQPTNQPINQSIHQSINQSINQSMNQSISQLTNQSNNQIKIKSNQSNPIKIKSKIKIKKTK